MAKGPPPGKGNPHGDSPGKDRGNSPSDPDNNGRGPDRDFDTQGPDKPPDGDGNNGPGNDPDCGDDAENRKLPPGCVKRQPPPPPPPPPSPPPPSDSELCGRQVRLEDLLEILEVYLMGKAPDVDHWLVDFPIGPEALFHIDCRQTVDLYWWTEETGWELIGRLNSLGDGAEIVLDLTNLFSHLEDNYKFELPGEHVVLAGETLFSIAERYGTSVEHLVEINGIADPNLISVGQVIQY